MSLLPGGAGTARFIKRRVSHGSPGSLALQRGRRFHDDHEALLAALDSGHFGGAWLDLMDPESLPSGPPIVAHGPLLHHAARDSQADEREHLVRHFLGNLERSIQGHTVVDRI